MATDVFPAVKEEIMTTVDSQEDDIITDAGVNDSGRPIRRPMNAFLLFCKRHRSLVKDRHPWLDNRSATKMLADMWAVLDCDEKEKYLALARQCKAAFLKAHPDYKWCGTNKTQSCSSTSPSVTTRRMHAVTYKDRARKDVSITPGKLADPADMGGLNLLLAVGEQALSTESSNTDRQEEISPNTDSCNNEQPETKQCKTESKSTLFQFAQMCSEQPVFEQQSDTTRPEFSTVGPQSQDAPSNKRQSGRKISTKKGLEKLKTEDCVRNGSSDNKRKSKTRTVTDVPTTCVSPSRTKVGKDREVVGGDCEMNSNGEGCADVAMETRRDETECGKEKLKTHCRKSSRSCKGKLYKQFVSGGMLNDLQCTERPFNCKKTRKGDFISYSDEDDPTVDMETKAAKRRRASSMRRRRASESNICRDRAEGSVSGTDSNNVDNLDYADFDFKAELDSLPQFTLDQFKPKSRSQTKKKSTNMYKNAMFIGKGLKLSDMEDYKDSHMTRLDPDGHFHDNSDGIAETKPITMVTGSRKRKARKQSITHIVRTKSDEGLSQITITGHKKSDVEITASPTKS